MTLDEETLENTPYASPIRRFGELDGTTRLPRNAIVAKCY